MQHNEHYGAFFMDKKRIKKQHNEHYGAFFMDKKRIKKAP